MNSSSPAPMSFLMMGAVHQMEAHLESALGGIGLSLAKFRVLSQLVEAGEPVPLSSLAERCACVRSNMTQLADRLEADKLVERVSDPNDRRSVLAALTPEGRARHDEGARVLAEAERELFGGLGEPDRDALARLVQLLKG
ncbi:MAG TPA: MarR family transcriptional regulator [Thermoanaerobaculia bacterium]|nr:MarR family transcriptional regulator [Thermoanaerobaculia bacterium]